MTAPLGPDEAEIHYALTAEGHHVAYQVAGEGPRNLLVVQSSFLPVDSLREEPSLARFHRRLESFSRVVTFDFRGIGLSDPVPPDAIPSIDHWAADALAVLDAAGCERTAVLAPASGALVGLLVAATAPERISALVTVNGTARMLPAPCYPVPEPDLFLRSQSAIDGGSGDIDFLTALNPSVAGDSAFRSWWDRSGRRGASPATATAITRAVNEADVRRILPLIAVPTLVVHRRECRQAGVEHGRYLAEHIPGARYLELPGVDNLYWVGDTDDLLDEIEEFLTGTRHGPRTDRVLTTVLFTDIVGSTERIVEVGERRWRDLLDRHDQLIGRQLARFEGRQVKTTGDGVLATFDGPGRAIQCARAVRDAADELGLPVRAGIHTGEVEVRGSDIGGLSVHIGARIAAAAGPGEVLVSRTVTDLVVGSDMAFADRGEHELKGVPGRWQLFAVEDEEASRRLQW